jgi:hypothetical protein
VCRDLSISPLIACSVKYPWSEFRSWRKSS